MVAVGQDNNISGKQTEGQIVSKQHAKEEIR